MKGNFFMQFINFVYKQPVRFNVTLKGSFPPSMQRMVVVFRGQRFFVNNHAHHFGKFLYVLAAFLHKIAFSSEGSGKPRFQHGLIVRV